MDALLLDKAMCFLFIKFIETVCFEIMLFFFICLFITICIIIKKSKEWMCENIMVE